MEISIVSTVALGLVSLFLVLLLRQYRPEYAAAASLLTGLLLLSGVMREIGGLILALEAIFARTESGYIPILFKIIGVCLVVQLATDTCRDSGEGALASRIEIAGKVAILALVMPLYHRILEIAAELIGR